MADTMSTAQTTTVTIKASELARVLANVSVFASTDKARPTLCAVLLERREGEALQAVATDSFCLAYEDIDTEDEAPADFSLLIDLADVKRLIAMAKAGGKYAMVTISLDGAMATFTTYDGSTTIRPVDGEFPPYRRLMSAYPGEGDGVAMIGLNPRRLARFAKVVPAEDVERRAKDRGSIPARFLFVNEFKPVTIRIGAKFTGLIMPVRLK